MLADRVRIFLTMLLTMATAVALVAGGWVLTSPVVPDPRPGAAEVVVRAFYHAVNQTIQTGDVTGDRAVAEVHAAVVASGTTKPQRTH